MVKLIQRYLLNFAIWLDEGGNTLTGGDPGETISSRSAKARNEGRWWGCVMCKLLNLFQRGHCDKALEPDEGQRAVIPD